MTLIVGYNFGGCTVLLGDALVTGLLNQKNNDHPFGLPAHQSNDPFNPENDDVDWGIKGMTQKVVIINEHCAISWAGSEIAARTIIQELQKIALSKDVLISDIESILEETIKSNPNLSVTIIALIVNNHEAQLWSNIPKIIESKILGEVYYAGSGGNTLIDFLNQFDENNTIIPQDDEIVAFAASVALNFSNRLLSDEFNTQQRLSSLTECFGGIYEIAIFYGGKIQKISEITHVLLHAHLDSAGIFQISEPKLIIKQQIDESDLLIRSISTTLDSNGNVKIESQRGFHVTIPGTNSNEDKNLSALNMSFHSEFLCTTVAIWKHDTVIATPSCVRKFRSRFQSIRKGLLLMPCKNDLFYHYHKEQNDHILSLVKSAVDL